MADSELDEGRLLLELTRDVTSSLDLQSVLDKSLAALRRLIDFNGGSIQLVFDGYLQMVAGDPPPPAEAFGFRLPIGQGFGGRVALSGEPLYSPDATTDPRAHPEGRRRASVAGTRSWFGAPLIVHGETIGIVQLDDLEADAFPPPVQARILSFLPTVSAAVQHAQLYEREREAVARLHEVEQAKRDFVALVSHELRTPLTVVLGFSALLAEGSAGETEGGVGAIGRRIERAGKRLDEMLTDLLYISGIESGARAIDVAPTDVGVVIGEAIEAADRGTHTIEVEIAGDTPLALADPRLLTRMIGKLLDNAQKFSDGGCAVRVTARADRRDVVISVADEGIGIPEALLERVFEPFFQVDSSDTRSAGGMGTGLFLVRAMGTAIGAGVTVVSDKDLGSTFTVTVPAAPRR